MDRKANKRNWNTFQNDTGFVSYTPGTTQATSKSGDSRSCYFSDENPNRLNGNRNTSSFDSCLSSIPEQSLDQMSSSSATYQNRYSNINKTNTTGVGRERLGNTSNYVPPLPPRGPFSVETPFLSNTTPLVLATARQTGSSIMTSCNTDSVRQLQNSYTDRIATSSLSSDIPARRTPASSRERETNNRGSMSTEIEAISVADIRQVRQTTGNDNMSASIDTQIYMGVLWHGGKLGVAYYDLDTTIMYAMLDITENDDFKMMLKVLKEINPVQLVVSSKQDERLLNVLRQHATDIHGRTVVASDRNSMLQFLPSIDFSMEICKRRVISMDLPSVPEHYVDSERTIYLSSLLPFENTCMIRAVGGLLKYLEKMRVGIELEEAGKRLPVLDVKIVTLESQMMLDDTAYSALQIFQRESHPSVYKAGTSNSAKEGLSLFGIMNRTKSHTGSRLLRTWFQRPLIDKEEIQNRHAAIAYFCNSRNEELVAALEESVKNVKNISKILTKMRTSEASISDWQVLYKTVYSATSVKELCRFQAQSIGIIKKVTEQFTDDLHQVTNYIHKIVDFQECSLQSRFVVKPNVNENLDKKKRMYNGLPEYLTEVAYQELQNLGADVTLCSIIYIPQIGYLLAIPETAVVRQLGGENSNEIDGLEFVFLVNNVLHYRSSGTRELDILLGDTRCDITDIETSIMHKLQNIILRHSRLLLTVVDICSELDCLLSMASCAKEFSYIRPTITDENTIQIVNGRHPIQEACCSTFIPNNIQSDTEYGKIKILTGPNACGKSVYLKQVALIVFLAQIGSFVPAEEARLGLVDKIYTRIRSQESVSVGLSSFMLEINQMAEALKSAGENSLCIVDEFGKGTDVVDGLSLLCSCMRNWIDQGDKCPHVYLSTHFHSIIHQSLIPRSPTIKYLTLETLHNGNDLVFLYQLVEGHTSSSYACYVAAQGGLEESIIKRGLEVSELIRECKPVQRCDTGTEAYLNRCQKIVDKVLDIDLESTDIRAFLSTFVLPSIEGEP